MENKKEGGFHTRPAAYKDQIIYGTNLGRVSSRNYLTGKLKYSIDLGASIETPGVVYKGRIFFHLRNHKIFCLDVETGKILWAYRRSVPNMTTLQRASIPLIHNNKLYVGFADGHVVAMNIEDGVLLWESKLPVTGKFVDVDTTPVLYQNKYLLMGSWAGPFSLVNLSNGQVVRTFPFNATRAPVVEKGNLFVPTDDGSIKVLGNGLKQVREVKLAKDHAVVAVGFWKQFLVAATSNGVVHFHRRDNLKPIEQLALGHDFSNIFGGLVIKQKRLAFLTSRNRLFVMK